MALALDGLAASEAASLLVMPVTFAPGADPGRWRLRLFHPPARDGAPPPGMELLLHRAAGAQEAGRPSRGGPILFPLGAAADEPGLRAFGAEVVEMFQVSPLSPVLTGHISSIPPVLTGHISSLLPY